MKRTMALVATLFLLGCPAPEEPGPHVTRTSNVHGKVSAALFHWYGDTYAVKLDDGKVVEAHVYTAAPCFEGASGMDVTLEEKRYDDGTCFYTVTKLEQKTGGRP